MDLSRLNFLSAELLARLPLEMFYRLGNINISSADVCLFETLIQQVPRPILLFTFPEMMQVDCQLPCNCGDDALLAECRSTICKPQPPAPQVVVPKRSGQRDQDTTWDLLFHYRRIKPGFLNLREADLPYRLLGICNIFRASALDRMTSCFGRWARRIMSS